MIYTLTLNPAIDKTIVVEEFKRNQVNRSLNSRKDVGGKGINVSKVLNEFGINNLCTTGILGSENADFFLNYLRELNVKTDFYIVPGTNRTNIKIVEKTLGTVTDINNKGFRVEQSDMDVFLKHFFNLVKKEDLVVISGSLPEGAEKHIYRDIIEILNERSCKVILDASGTPLLHGIKAIPYAIKPNIDELKSIVPVDKENPESILAGGKYLIDMGIEKVLISLGAKGAIYITKEHNFISKGVNVDIKSTVGAGDAMIAGMIYAIENEYSDSETLKLAIACGAAKVMTEGTKIPDIKTIKKLSKEIQIESLI